MITHQGATGGDITKKPIVEQLDEMKVDETRPEESVDTNRAQIEGMAIDPSEAQLTHENPLDLGIELPLEGPIETMGEDDGLEVSLVPETQCAPLGV